MTTPETTMPRRNSRIPMDIEPYQFLFFSQLLQQTVCTDKTNTPVGPLADLVFKLSDPYPEAVGLILRHGGEKPNLFIPWENVVKIEGNTIFVSPREDGKPYQPFADQAGWLLLNQHLMDQNILDLDRRRCEQVHDVHLLFSIGRMVIVHMDISINGRLRRWHLPWLCQAEGELLTWSHVQPFCLEDVGVAETASLAVTRPQIPALPDTDLAAALETLSTKEQQALLSVLKAGKAAQVLLETSPQTQRRIVANLAREKSRLILAAMSTAQLVDLFSVLQQPHGTGLMELLPPDTAKRIQAIISSHESTARALMSTEYLAKPAETTVGELLREIRASSRPRESISYIYIISDAKLLLGAVDLRVALLSPDETPLAKLMSAPIVSAHQDDLRKDLSELFVKYQYRMIPVVDSSDQLLGVIHSKDILKSYIARLRG